MLLYAFPPFALVQAVHTERHDGHDVTPHPSCGSWQPGNWTGTNPESGPNLLWERFRVAESWSLYSLKCCVFASWCAEHSHYPLTCPTEVILSFPQYMFKQGWACSTLHREYLPDSSLKVYLEAISACQVVWNGVTRGARRLQCSQDVTKLYLCILRFFLYVPPTGCGVFSYSVPEMWKP